ncbi:hypothetical protein SK128_004342 [Halocaridina rubra]|uniref:Uncharacterized protein n=1 Tax=Halocaridina rubra TaxID=373956 RepID=A0AAN8ZTM5_HALRR
MPPRRKKVSPEARARLAKLKRRQEIMIEREHILEELENRGIKGDFSAIKNRQLKTILKNADAGVFLPQFPPVWTYAADGSQNVDSLQSQNYGDQATSSNTVDSSSVGEAVGDKGKQEVEKSAKVESEVGGDVKAEEGDASTEEGHGSEAIDPMSCVEVNAENFVVDCDPLIVADNGLASEANKPLSSDENSSFSSSSNNLFFNELMENNDLFFKKMSGFPNTTNDAELAKALQDHYDKLEELTEHMLEKRKRAALIQRRRRKRMLEKMTDDELKMYRATQTDACRMRRMRRLERMSEDERTRDRLLKNALCLARRHRREALMSEDERRDRRAAAAAAQREKRRKKRETMSDEEIKAHKAEVAAIWRMRRHLRHMRMSEDELRAERAKAAEAKRLSRLKQKDTEGPVADEELPEKKKPRRRKSKSQTSESESDAPDSNSFGMDGNAESLISQILKQTQHIAAMQSEQGDLIPQHPLMPSQDKELGAEQHLQKSYLPNPSLTRHPTNKNMPANSLTSTVQGNEDPPELQIPRVQQPSAKCGDNENYCVSNRTTEHQPTSDKQPLNYHHTPNLILDPQGRDSSVKVKEELDEDGNEREGSPQTSNRARPVSSMNEAPHYSHSKGHDVVQNGVAQYHRDKSHERHSEGNGNIHTSSPSESLPQFHQNRVPDNYPIGMPQHFHHNRLENDNRIEALQQRHHRPYESEQMMPPHDLYHNRMLYRPPISSLPPFHYNRFHDPHNVGMPHAYHPNKMVSEDQSLTSNFHHSNIHNVSQGGISRDLHHKDVQDNQPGSVQQFHYGGNYMNTLY